jgi:hypothetical protein
LTDVSVHSYGLIFGQEETGPVVLDRLQGVRRPGTNRLSAGGFPALTMKGGSIALINSELSYNFDDLTDMQSSLAFAFSQVTFPPSPSSPPPLHLRTLGFSQNVALAPPPVKKGVRFGGVTVN